MKKEVVAVMMVAMIVEHDTGFLTGNAGKPEGSVPGELSTDVPLEHRRDVTSIRSYLLEKYKANGLKHKFRKAGQDVVVYYSGHKLQILVGVGLATSLAAGAGLFIVYGRGKRK